jgi:hypothetical protein
MAIAHETIVTLRPGYFGDKERVFIEHAGLSASLLRFDTGVEAVRIRNARGEITVLPFQGQQVWDARFDERVLTMKSMFTQPLPTREYLANYGAFLIHCGATAMGNPSKDDTHPLHGELPNAPYGAAWLAVGTDEGGPYIAVCGEYRHTIAFSLNYAARPRVLLRDGGTMVSASIEIENLKKTPMDLMYMAHVNFRPLDNGRLVYSAPCSRETVRVRTVIPAHVVPTEKYLAFLKELSENPAKHNVLAPGLAFDPEVVFFLSYRANKAGWASSMMVHPDGYASLIRHRPDQLDHGVRWISRTPDQDCFGLCLPSTAEPDGYRAEKAKGNLRSLAGGQAVRFDCEAGLLTPAEAREEEKAIARILSE